MPQTLVIVYVPQVIVRVGHAAVLHIVIRVFPSIICLDVRRCLPVVELVHAPTELVDLVDIVGIFRLLLFLLLVLTLHHAISDTVVAFVVGKEIETSIDIGVDVVNLFIDVVDHGVDDCCDAAYRFIDVRQAAMPTTPSAITIAASVIERIVPRGCVSKNVCVSTLVIFVRHRCATLLISMRTWRSDNLQFLRQSDRRN